MKTQHTPGPWSARWKSGSDETTNHWKVNCDGSCGHQWHVADVFGIMEDEATYGHGFAEANARLIAAAPELLAALKKAAHYLEIHSDDPRTRNFISLELKPAIAKATGKE